MDCRAQTKDMRNDAVKLFYSPPEAFKAAIGDYLKNVLNHYNKFDGYAANARTARDVWRMRLVGSYR